MAASADILFDFLARGNEMLRIELSNSGYSVALIIYRDLPVSPSLIYLDPVSTED